jgi:hypothetical protein
MDTKTQNFQRRIKSLLDLSTRELDSFQKSFNKDYEHAFTWADSAMKASVSFGYAAEILNAISKGRTVKEIQDYYIKSLINGASNLPKSTSTCSNEIKKYHIEVMAQILDYIEFS